MYKTPTTEEVVDAGPSLPHVVKPYESLPHSQVPGPLIYTTFFSWFSNTVWLSNCVGFLWTLPFILEIV